MISSVNIGTTLTLLPDARGVYSLKSIDGLATPTYRTTSFVYGGRNGGQVPDQKYGQRMVTFEGGIDEDSCDEHIQARQDFLNAIDFNVNVPVTVNLTNGKSYMLYAKFEQPTLPIEAKKFTDFQLIAIAEDWRLYDVTGGDENSVTILKLVDGGARWLTGSDGAGWRWLVGSGLRWGAGNGATNVVNSGLNYAYPKITITGANQNPTLTNNTTNQQVRINVSTSPGDVIEISTDPAMKYAKLNGGNINGLVQGGAIDFSLAPGDNLVTFNNDNTSGGEATLQWYDSITGI